MNAVEVVTGTGGKVSIDAAKLEPFKAGLRGMLLRQGDAGYDQARTIWNAMIDKRPALIVQCLGVADVMRSVNFARDNGLLLAVKGGGHNIAGNAVCDGGLLVDLAMMKSVRVDAKARRANVEPGVKLGELDHETQAFGLAVPLGINSTTGVAGLTLGGGFGWFSRKHGLTIDNLVSVDVVTAEGQVVRASERENKDLFWGIRGGGGNFGIVTNFEFQLHPLGPEVFGGLVVYPLDQAKAALMKYAEFVEKMPEEMSIWFVLRKAPPLPFLPADFVGKEMIGFAIFYGGEVAKGKQLTDPVRHWGKPVGEHLGPMPYTAWQQVIDPLLTPGFRNYWKSHNLAMISEGFIDTVVKFAGQLPSPHTEIACALIGAGGSKASKVAEHEMAWAHRGTKLVMNIHGRWETPAEDQKVIGWARDLWNDNHQPPGRPRGRIPRDQGMLRSAAGVYWLP
ncbi:MAG: FAD-binding oxidoreductase [Chloroflexi bacterium]|nr:FAD-binding oxidoreductase [Chloroflexota bacterium]